jgi:hypothetical protein
MQLFGDLDLVSLVRRSRLKWIGHASRMDNKRKVCQVFYNSPQCSRTFLIILFISIAHISHWRFIAVRYEFEHSA